MAEPNYSLEPPRTDLITHHTYEQVEEDRVIDTSPQALDGQVVGSVTFDYPGVVGQAARLKTGGSISVTELTDHVPTAEVSVGSWGKTERAVPSGQTNVTFEVTVGGSTTTITHTVNEEVTEWQFAFGTYDGSTMRLYHTRLGEGEPALVNSTSLSGDADAFKLELHTEGRALVDDTRVYRTAIQNSWIDDIYHIGADHQSVDDIGDAWPTTGIPYVGGNRRLAGALGERHDQWFREIDAIREARHIADAAGEQLDRIGNTIGVNRETGESDSAYRARIQANFIAGRSSGTFEDIVTSMATILDVPVDNIDMDRTWEVTSRTNGGVAELYLDEEATNNTDIPDATLKEIADDLAAVGHRINVNIQPQNPFTIKAVGATDDPDLGLTGPNTARGGKLVP